MDSSLRARRPRPLTPAKQLLREGRGGWGGAAREAGVHVSGRSRSDACVVRARRLGRVVASLPLRSWRPAALRLRLRGAGEEVGGGGGVRRKASAEGCGAGDPSCRSPSGGTAWGRAPCAGLVGGWRAKGVLAQQQPPPRPAAPREDREGPWVPGAFSGVHGAPRSCLSWAVAHPHPASRAAARTTVRPPAWSGRPASAPAPAPAPALASRGTCSASGSAGGWRTVLGLPGPCGGGGGRHQTGAVGVGSGPGMWGRAVSGQLACGKETQGRGFPGPTWAAPSRTPVLGSSRVCLRGL